MRGADATTSCSSRSTPGSVEPTPCFSTCSITLSSVPAEGSGEGGGAYGERADGRDGARPDEDHSGTPGVAERQGRGRTQKLLHDELHRFDLRSRPLPARSVSHCPCLLPRRLEHGVNPNPVRLRRRGKQVSARRRSEQHERGRGRGETRRGVWVGGGGGGGGLDHDGRTLGWRRRPGMENPSDCRAGAARAWLSTVSLMSWKTVPSTISPRLSCAEM